ncbi:MAG: hypothetical protein B7733_12920 [Myxococcales bacterium FL481]|nr:MAG: hypothetical protein B7733_12920 [Myxococcales bacterium FL481]
MNPELDYDTRQMLSRRRRQEAGDVVRLIDVIRDDLDSAPCAEVACAERTQRAGMGHGRPVFSEGVELVRGGQGREPQELSDCARVFLFVAGLSLALAALSMLGVL